MERVVTRAGIWFAVMLVALFAAATAADSGFAVHMGIVVIAAALLLWVTVSKQEYGAIARGILRVPEDPSRYDDDPIRWGSSPPSSGRLQDCWSD